MCNNLQLDVSDEESGLRLDVLLRRRISWRSRNNLQKMIESGGIYVNKKDRKPSFKVRKGMVVSTLIKDPSTFIYENDYKIMPDVLYEDDNVLAINKPPFLACTPTSRHFKDNLVSLLRSKYKSNPDPLQPVHRLDRETSGVVLVAKTIYLRKLLGALFENRNVIKKYLAIVSGVPEHNSGIIDVPIGNSVKSNVMIKKETGSGRNAITEYRVIKIIKKKNLSLISVKPLTGRAHQIRVHMAYLGCPILGDKIYGANEEIFLESLNGEVSKMHMNKLAMNRHALHARSIEFKHPVNGEVIFIKAPVPVDFRNMLT
ncbi:MAG: RluA family pseudouridine synthase [Candidatus Theseobacter exili]|nr:RluA family pseudouridine synthase [Candidatus Theseobacter exili]